MQRRQKMRRVLASLMVLSILFNIVVPERAEADVPTWEMNPTLLGAVTETAGSQTAATSQSLYEWAQHFIKETLRKKLLDMVVDQIIQWIQGGGKPQFVTDWSGFLDEVANQTAGDFAQELGLGFLCSPFNLQVQVALLPVPKFTKQASCTLDEIVGNIEGFYDNFANGGWIAYTGSLEPQNNYFGSILIASAELEKRKEKAQEAAQNEAVAGGGFLSTKKCDVNGENCTITTPGQTIGAITAKAIGSDIDYLVNADELEAYVGAIANAAINKLIVTGVNGLKGLSTSNAPQGGSSSGVGTCAGLSGAAYAACLNYSGVTGNSFAGAKQNLLSLLSGTVVPYEAATATLGESAADLAAYAISLGNLQTSFSSLTCVSQGAALQQITTELAYASSTSLTVLNKKSLVDAKLAELENLTALVANLVENDWLGFSSVQNEIQASGLIDAAGAASTKVNADTENAEIEEHIEAKLDDLNEKLGKCSVGS